MSFDWETEEDGEWEDQTWQEKPETAVSPQPPWRTILLIGMLLFVAGFVIYQQVEKRLDAATTAVESDIFAAHNLLSRAAANQDADLGKAVLSGRDKSWSRIQSDLLTTGLFYEHTGLGLTLTDADAAYAPLFREDERFIDLLLSPDLNEAELSYVRDFWAFTEDGLQMVTLQQTAVYRRGETRWLLSPPLEPFWGEWQTAEFENLTYSYPIRDEEIIEQLSNDLQTLLEETCIALPELNCSPDTTLQIRFEKDPVSLLETADPANLYTANLRFDLPTPTLVGLPIDDAGYQALLNAYGAKLIAALIANSVAYDCCDHAPMFQAIMTYQLSELGLVKWPVTQELQQSLVNSGVHAEMLFQYWNSTDFSLIEDENGYKLLGFVDFLLKQHIAAETPLWVMKQMNATFAYQSWVANLSDGSPNSMDPISRDWWFYALTQSEILNSSRQPISLPAQDLQVGCLDNGAFSGAGVTQTTLLRYEVDDENWAEEFVYDGLAFFNPLPQDDGVVLQLIEVSEDQYWQTMLWRNGSSDEVMNIEDVYSISLGQMDPNGRFLLSYFGDDEIEEALPEPLLIDMESCLAGECSSTLLGQTPYWSPDGQKMLLTDLHLFESGQYTVDGRIIAINPESFNQVSPLWLRSAAGNAEDAVKIDEGASPFWITNDLFGYIRPVPASSTPSFQEVVVVSTANLEPETVIETTAVRDAIPDNNRNNALIFRYAIAHPTDTDLFLLMASTQANDSYLFQVNRRTQVVTLLFPLDLSRGEHSLGFSPDGRFLVATGTIQQETTSPGPSLPFGALYLYDLESGELKTILTNTDLFFPAFTFDWSSDGNWLAFSRDNNVIGLLAPAYDYQQMIIHEEGSCTSLAWVNPLPAE
ncbi:MAG: hypothetical protein DHS20C20_34370 [Ardenticatenaceae bacterium]|nr:MAG: hypothetical protein DHS20C20_34370 [Ardenticatenaceae bacterium]